MPKRLLREGGWVNTAAAPPPAPQRLSAEVDHLVVAAATLDQGVQWCEATFGVTPGPGGRHALFGTHNRLLKLGGAASQNTYLEIIAVEPEGEASGSGRLAQPRWFGLDDAALQAELAMHGPRLLHVVARTADIAAHLQALASAGAEAGRELAASRATAAGLLEWRIAVRPDGALLAGGALPTLIEWRGPHPTGAMADTPLQLRSLTLAGVPAPWQTALNLAGVAFVAQSAPPASALVAEFSSPRGLVRIASHPSHVPQPPSS